MKLLSFIIPSYNSEKFLSKCLESILSGNISDKIEIVIVNDGSADSTENIAKDYCLRYPDTVKFVSQENRGHGGAINSGCASATGKYLKVIDADDWVMSENLKPFIEWLDNIESDVVITNYLTFDISDNSTKKINSYMPEFGREYSLQEIVLNWQDFDRTVTFHGITYKTAFYRENLKLLTEHVFFEDHEFSTFPCCFAKTVMPLDLFIYVYRIGDITQSVSDANQLKRISHYETVLDSFLKEYRRIKDSLQSYEDDFVCIKTKILLMSYITVLLLVDPDKKTGRQTAKVVMGNIAEAMPKVYRMVRKKYNVLRFMNYLHISKRTMDKIIASKLYRTVKGAHDLD